MTAPLPDDLQRRRTLFLGGLLLCVGFGAGFVVGQESARGARPAVAVAAVDPHAGHDHGPTSAGTASAVPGTVAGSAGADHGKARGHTFTGDIQVPPHGPEGHDRASALLAGAACPCGGCGGEPLLQCGCDTAREIEGLAAHLLERGRPDEEVRAQLRSHYGLAIAAGGPAPARRDGVGRDPLEGLSGVMDGRPRGPIDVPSSARPGSSN